MDNLKFGKNAMKSLADFQQITQPVIVPISTTNLSDPKDLSLQSKLFHDLYLLSEQTKGTKMLFNIQLAALHLSYMLKAGQEDLELNLVRLARSLSSAFSVFCRLCLIYLPKFIN